MTSKPQQTRSETLEFNDSGEILVPPTVYSQLEAVRRSGVVNMFTQLWPGLELFGFTQAKDWVLDNPEAYVHGIMSGFAPTDPSVVENINIQPTMEALEEVEIPDRDPPASIDEARLLDYLKEIIPISSEAFVYYENGTSRTTKRITKHQRTIVQQADQAVGFQSNRAYKNALLTAAILGQKYGLTYVEGYYWGAGESFPVAHAWVEQDGTVLELTFPEGPQPDENSLYFGVPFALETVRDWVFNNETAEPQAGK